MLYNTNDLVTGAYLDSYGEFHHQLNSMYSIFINKNMTVLDVGAGVGCSTLSFAKLAGEVIAIEPQRLLFNMLCANISLNSFDNVFCYKFTLGNFVGNLMAPDYNFSNEVKSLSVKKQEPKHTPIVQTTIDTLDVKKVEAINIDVEDCELDIIDGAKQTIEKYKPILFVVSSDDNVKNKLESLNYTVLKHTFDVYNDNNYFMNPSIIKNEYSFFVSIPEKAF